MKNTDNCVLGKRYATVANKLKRDPEAPRLGIIEALMNTGTARETRLANIPELKYIKRKKEGPTAEAKEVPNEYNINMLNPKCQLSWCEKVDPTIDDKDLSGFCKRKCFIIIGYNLGVIQRK